jgi:hypothetical protein
MVKRASHFNKHLGFRVRVRVGEGWKGEMDAVWLYFVCADSDCRTLFCEHTEHWIKKPAFPTSLWMRNFIREECLRIPISRTRALCHGMSVTVPFQSHTGNSLFPTCQFCGAETIVVGFFGRCVQCDRVEWCCEPMYCPKGQCPIHDPVPEDQQLTVVLRPAPEERRVPFGFE